MALGQIILIPMLRLLLQNCRSRFASQLKLYQAALVVWQSLRKLKLVYRSLLTCAEKDSFLFPRLERPDFQKRPQGEFDCFELHVKVLYLPCQSDSLSIPDLLPFCWWESLQAWQNLCQTMKGSARGSQLVKSQPARALVSLSPWMVAWSQTVKFQLTNEIHRYPSWPVLAPQVRIDHCCARDWQSFAYRASVARPSQDLANSPDSPFALAEAYVLW